MLRIEKVSKQYRDGRNLKQALNQISLVLTSGVHALLGPNGAGKSTLMKLITCNLSPTEGGVYWESPAGAEEDAGHTGVGGGGSVPAGVPAHWQEINRMGAAYRSLIGYAPQQQGLYEAYTGYRFLRYMAVLKKLPSKLHEKEIARVAESVHLQDVLRHRIRSYSGGMKQRLLVAQALLGDPKLLVFDEPTVGLDPDERVRIREYIHGISEGRIVLIATHVVSDVESIADDVIILKEGEVVEQDGVRALCEKHQADNLEQVYIKIFHRSDQEMEG